MSNSSVTSKFFKEDARGILWNGNNISIDERGINDAKKLYFGEILPNANDIRRNMLVGSVRNYGQRELMKEYYRKVVDELINKKFPELEENYRHNRKNMVYLNAIEFTSNILEYAFFCSSTGEDYINVKISKSIVRRAKQFSINNDVLELFVDDMVVEEFQDMDVLVECISSYLSNELGFFIKSYDKTSGLFDIRTSDDVQKAIRISWFKPDMQLARNKIKFESEIESWEYGVPIEDIVS